MTMTIDDDDWFNLIGFFIYRRDTIKDRQSYGSMAVFKQLANNIMLILLFIIRPMFFRYVYIFTCSNI